VYPGISAIASFDASVVLFEAARFRKQFATEGTENTEKITSSPHR